RRTFIGNVPGSPYFGLPVPWNEIYEGSSDETTNTVNRSLCYPVSCKIATDRYTGLDEGENRSNLFRDDYFIRLSETILLRADIGGHLLETFPDRLISGCRCHGMKFTKAAPMKQPTR